MAEVSFDNLKVEEVLNLVNSGEISVEKALEFEKQGKNRTTLIKELTELLESKDDGPDEENNAQQEEKTLSETTKVILVKNIKYNGKRHKAGQEIEISNKDVDSFIKLGVIAGE